MAIFKITSELPANRYHNISSDFRALKQYLGISTKLSSDIAVSQQAHLLETLYLSPVEVTSIGTDDTKLKSNIQMDIKAKPRRNPIPSSLVEGVCASTPPMQEEAQPYCFEYSANSTHSNSVKWPFLGNNLAYKLFLPEHS